VLQVIHAVRQVNNALTAFRPKTSLFCPARNEIRYCGNTLKNAFSTPRIASLGTVCQQFAARLLPAARCKQHLVAYCRQSRTAESNSAWDASRQTPFASARALREAIEVGLPATHVVEKQFCYCERQFAIAGSNFAKINGDFRSANGIWSATEV
jgi:hypothetical protein